MSISIKKYVDITSGVGGASAAKERELILRIFTSNSAVPAGVVVEMTTLNDVGVTFGTDSEEYKRAAMYFNFISKSVTQAKKISFAHYAGGGAIEPSIQGGAGAETVVNSWKLIIDGQLKFTVGDIPVDINGLSFATVVSLTEVASIIQTAIRTIGGMGEALVVYDNVNLKFNANFVGVTPPADIVMAAAVGGTDLKDPLGWTTGDGVTLSPGTLNSDALNALMEADGISDNYGSFVFAGPAQELVTVESVAEWNSAQNVKYMYLVPVLLGDVIEWYETLKGYAGCAMTIVNEGNTEYDEQVPGVILGATDYTLRNAGQNYMFQQIPGLTPKVNDNQQAEAIDSATRVNYYGRTKNAGQPIDLYQNGYLCGTNTAPLQMNVHANEQWLKSNITTQMMDLLLGLPIIPASSEGRIIVLGGLQSSVEKALWNGTIKAEKDLTLAQRAYIYQITGDPLAWQQVQSIGYWMDAEVIPEQQPNGTTRYRVNYTLVYSKADAVNKITGRDILI